MEQVFSMTGMPLPGPDAKAKIAQALYSRVQGGSQASRDVASSLANGLPNNYEGIGDAYALKFGQQGLVDALMQMQQGMPLQQMRRMDGQIDQAGREYDAMRSRENIRFRGGQNWGRF